MNYTQGNWYWNLVNGKHHSLRSKNGNLDRHILYISPDFMGNDSLDNKDNAQLISAAPDIYEALKILIAQLDSVGSVALGDFEIAKKALAKAEGK
jgi:hypothetical protein